MSHQASPHVLKRPSFSKTASSFFKLFETFSLNPRPTRANIFRQNNSESEPRTRSDSSWSLNFILKNNKLESKKYRLKINHSNTWDGFSFRAEANKFRIIFDRLNFKLQNISLLIATWETKTLTLGHLLKNKRLYLAPCQTTETSLPPTWPRFAPCPRSNRKIATIYILKKI